MIEGNVKIHNRYSVEIKLGFIAEKNSVESEFAVNTWIFIPNSLDINASNYDKKDFYRDLKSNTRLITPVYLLHELAAIGDAQMQTIETSYRNVRSDPTKLNLANYEYHIKMLLSIVKSALREKTLHILNTAELSQRSTLIASFVENVYQIISVYRKLWPTIKTSGTHSDLVDYFRFGDEFLSNIIEQHSFRLLNAVEQKLPDETIPDKLILLISSEIEYRKLNGYLCVDEASTNHNRDLVHRLGLLKKFTENVLFLYTRKKKDGILQEQVYFSIAAGISMIFATLIAFSFQQKFGNLTMPFFVALVVSYMLKDRIKELGRYYFAHKLGRRYFDHKTKIKLNDMQVGWSKEAMDFIPEEKVPQEIIRLRGRSTILGADNRFNGEKIILYRKRFQINRKKLDHCGANLSAGINDIIRLNVSGLMLKMDNPEMPLFYLNQENQCRTINGEKIYYINLIMQFKSGSQNQYQRIRLIVNRNGISELEQMSPKEN